MNLRFVLHGVLIALPAAGLAAAAGLVVVHAVRVVGPPPDPTPPPPTILASPGPGPAAAVSFQELPRYQGHDYGGAVGCGFFFSVRDGQQIVAATTAHSVSLRNPNRSLERIAFQVPGQPNPAFEFDTLSAPPGRARTGDDMSVDYLLLYLSPPDRERIRPEHVLLPDPRGGPQPGERVSLYKCLGTRSGDRILSGTVQSATPTAVWILMDDRLSLDMMSGSGSPFVSQYTGRVVGMLIAGSIRRERISMAAHPIASLVHRAETATGLEPILPVE